MSLKRVKISDIKIGNVIRSPLLPEGFIKRVVDYKKKLEEVEKIPLEETILNFQKDVHPEQELEIWEHIANLYEKFINENKNLSLEEKVEACSVLLRRSTGEDDFSDAKKLTKQQIEALKSAFK